MVSTKNVQSVLRMVWAGKEEAPVGAPATPEAPVTHIQKPTDQRANLKDSYIYYFFLAPTDKAINFPNLENELRNDQTRNTLVDNLRGEGNKQTEYSAGYFTWKKMIIAKKSEQDPRKYYVYSADINPVSGVIDTASETLVPANSGESVSGFKNKFPEIFKSGSIVLLNSKNDLDVFYVRGMPAGNAENQLQTNPELGNTETTQVMDRAAFERDIVDKYRIWTGKELLKPDFSVATNDMIEGRRYLGGKNEYQTKIVKILNEVQPESKTSEAPQQPSLGDQMRQQKEESPFEPVDEQGGGKVEPVSEVPTGRGIKMFAQDINSIRRVMMGYLKDAYDPVSPATVPQTQMSMSKKNKGLMMHVTGDPRVDQTTLKKLDTIAQRAQQEAERAQHST